MHKTSTNFSAVFAHNIQVAELLEGATTAEELRCFSTVLDFYARQHNAIARICYRPSVCPSVCLSVRHTGGSYKNG